MKQSCTSLLNYYYQFSLLFILCYFTICRLKIQAVVLVLRIYHMYLQSLLILKVEETEGSMVVVLALPYAKGNLLLQLLVIPCA